MNRSEEERATLYSAGTHEENVFFTIFYMLLLVSSVPCNALALWVFMRGQSCTPSTVLLQNLAIADISYVLVLPMRVLYHAAGSRWLLGEAPCRLVGFFFFLNLYCSLYFVAFISVDRLLAVALPPRCQRLRCGKKASVACAMLWVTGIVSMSPVLFTPQTSTLRSGVGNVTVCSQLYLEKASSSALASTAVAVTVPLVTLLVSYTLILLRLRATPFPERTRAQRKAAAMIVLTVLNCLVAFVPYHAHRFLYIERHTRGHISDAEIRSLAFGNRLTSAITCFSAVLDPVMYFFLARNYRQALLKMCGRTVDKEKQPSTT
ncbi:uracil nucleotide/cysteinyl leukotriene receptor [Electrophorus electricus]|uniref:uracil nucleotide/cysteinyl leukotriene receptor n=1 Tax=Electrophorus electricus TaxID=8005 RepID=UPI0015D05FD0|nr:uracil nucleotide/cysteinyl leukotriene receptor [Electrophorus electricus]